jgi:hypothetical protein
VVPKCHIKKIRSIPKRADVYFSPPPRKKDNRKMKTKRNVGGILVNEK